MRIVHTDVPDAFITVEEARTAEKGYFTPVGNPKLFSRNSVRISK